MTLVAFGLFGVCGEPEIAVAQVILNDFKAATRLCGVFEQRSGRFAPAFPFLTQGLIERIELRPIAGGYEIELVGKIAKMIELSAWAESSRVGAYASSVKLVAGAHKHLYRTIIVNPSRAVPGVRTDSSPVHGDGTEPFSMQPQNPCHARRNRGNLRILIFVNALSPQ